MEPQNNSQPVNLKVPKKVSLFLFISVLSVLLVALVATAYLYKSTENNLAKEIGNLSEANNILIVKEKDNKKEAVQNKTEASKDPSDALVESVVRSVCAANISSCTNISTVARTYNYTEVSLNSQSEIQPEKPPIKSMLLKKLNEGIWSMVFTAESSKICNNSGTDQPDVFAYCKT